MATNRTNGGTPKAGEDLHISRDEMIALLNGDLSREYQAIIGYVVYSQTLKGAAYMDIARELESHAGEELQHALKLSKQIDYLGGTPAVTADAVKISDKPREMLRFDLENERLTIANYRKRIQQAEAMGEFALSEILRGIIVEEQEHEIDLAAALGAEAPKLEPEYRGENDGSGLRVARASA